MRSARIKYTLMHYFLPLVLVMIADIAEVKGQRIYADAELHTTTLFTSVTNPTNSITTPYTDYTTISATLGLLGLIEATQTVSYNGSNKPTPSTPITIKFGATNSLLSLLDGIFIQPTLNGVPVGLAYSNTTVLSLLSALGSPTDAEITLPAPGVNYDGIRFRVSSSLLGAVITSRLYYASFIVAPTVSPVTICSGTPVTLSVTNAQAGYTYNWYSAGTGGTAIQSGTTTTFTPNPNLNATTTYYVEAVQTVGGTYYSARSPITVTITPKPPSPHVIITTNSQY